MHPCLSEFPSNTFYEGTLQVRGLQPANWLGSSSGSMQHTDNGLGVTWELHSDAVRPHEGRP